MAKFGEIVLILYMNPYGKSFELCFKRAFMNKILIRKRLALLLIFINYLLEFLYISVRLLGIQLWLTPIDLSSMEGQISYKLYLFEGIFVGQMFLVWMISWRQHWRVQVSRKWHGIILFGLTGLLGVVVNCVFFWDAQWPAMLDRRLFAFESWILITLLSIYLQVTYIN